MRILVNLKCDSNITLPINQNYFLASSIYRLISCRPEFSKFLHDRGYVHEESGKVFKLFTFSPIMGKDRRLVGENVVFGAGTLSWQITSPMQDFILPLAEGLLSEGSININDVSLPVAHIQTTPEPEITSPMKFKCLSPIVVSKTEDGNKYASYLSYDTPDLAHRVKLNLMKKYSIINGSIYKF